MLFHRSDVCFSIAENSIRKPCRCRRSASGSLTIPTRWMEYYGITAPTFFPGGGCCRRGYGTGRRRKVPLVAGRSLAVDRLIHTFGLPFFIHSPSLTHLDDGKPFARLMLALDTGSAIIGPARGDIFTGSSFEAGELAGTVRNEADFYILIPRVAAQRYRR